MKKVIIGLVVALTSLSALAGEGVVTVASTHSLSTLKSQKRKKKYVKSRNSTSQVLLLQANATTK